MYNPFSLENKKILITGGASGIGLSTALEASKMGAEIILLDINQENLEKTKSILPSSIINSFVADLTDPNSVQEIINKLDPIDGLVNCAGIALTKPFKFCGKEDLERIMYVNFFGPVLFTQSLVKKNLISRNGSIVYLSSIDGTVCGHIGNSAYSASKGAVMGSVRSQALELASKGIRVNCVSPARVNTPLLKRDNITEEQVEENKKLYPLKRYAEPEEIAYYIIYLLSDASTYTTGSNLIIDGGFTLL